MVAGRYRACATRPNTFPTVLADDAATCYRSACARGSPGERPDRGAGRSRLRAGLPDCSRAACSVAAGPRRWTCGSPRTRMRAPITTRPCERRAPTATRTAAPVEPEEPAAKVATREPPARPALPVTQAVAAPPARVATRAKVATPAARAPAEQLEATDAASPAGAGQSCRSSPKTR